MILSPMKEMDIYGVFVPPLLAWGVFSLFAVKVIHVVLARKGFYQSDVEQQLFDVALFVLIASLLSFCVF